MKTSAINNALSLLLTISLLATCISAAPHRHLHKHLEKKRDVIWVTTTQPVVMQTVQLVHTVWIVPYPALPTRTGSSSAESPTPSSFGADVSPNAAASTSQLISVQGEMRTSLTNNAAVSTPVFVTVSDFAPSATSSAVLSNVSSVHFVTVTDLKPTILPSTSSLSSLQFVTVSDFAPTASAEPANTTSSIQFATVSDFALSSSTVSSIQFVTVSDFAPTSSTAASASSSAVSSIQFVTVSDFAPSATTSSSSSNSSSASTSTGTTSLTTTAPTSTPSTTTSLSGTTEMSSGLAAANTQYTGNMTYYTPGSGTCGLSPSPSSYSNVVSISHLIMQPYDASNGRHNPLCGKQVTITYGSGSAARMWTAIVGDTCAECGVGELMVGKGFYSRIVSGAGVATSRDVSEITWVWD